MTGTDEKNLLTDAGSWLGVLVGGLAGAFTFLGLGGDELATVLRNEGITTTLVVGLLTLTIVVAALSVFVGKATFDLWYVVGGLGVSLAVLVAIAAIVPVPGTSDTSKCVAGGVAIALIVASLVAFGIGIDKRKDAKRKTVPGQPILVVASVLLLAAGIFAAVRAEVRSQSSTTHVQIEPLLTVDDHGTNLKLSIDASKLRVEGVVVVSVYGLERSKDLLTRTAEDGSTRDVQRQCGEAGRCVFIAGYVLNPDAVGKVADKVAVPIDAARFQHLALTALACTPPDREGPQVPTCNDPEADTGEFTTVDLRLPEPASPTTPTTP